MTALATTISTADVPESRRFALWRDAVCESFVPVDCERTASGPFAGEITRMPVNDLCVSRVRGRDYRVVRTARRIRSDRDEVLLVTLQLSGSLSLAQDGREVTLNPGDFACCDSTRPYVASVGGEFETLSLHVPREVWVRRFGPTEHLTALAVCGQSGAGALVADFLRQFLTMAGTVAPAAARRFSEVSLTLVTGALGDLITERHGSLRAGRTALLYRAKALIEESLHDPGLNREQVARALGISVRYLHDLFLQEGTTVCDWIWQRRLERCRRDLADPLLAAKSVGQIAWDCGFSDFSHFSRRFKAAYAVRPSEFRRRGH